MAHMGVESWRCMLSPGTVCLGLLILLVLSREYGTTFPR